MLLYFFRRDILSLVYDLVGYRPPAMSLFLKNITFAVFDLKGVSPYRFSI